VTVAGADFDDSHWRSAGERIQALIEACAADTPAAQARAEQLVREVVDLYGAALVRVMATVDDPALADRLAADDLIGSLLLVHGVHPQDVTERVSRALDGVRPYLGSHGGDVQLLGIADGVVQLSFSGSCKSCPSSAATLELAVEDAVRAAAPEIHSVEAVAAGSSESVIPVDSLMSRVHTGGHAPTTWYPVPELDELSPGEVAGFAIGDTVVLACRVGDAVLAYLDQCAECAQSLAGASLSGTVLSCPQCRAGFDVVHAGTGVELTIRNLLPVPVLARDGVLSMAVPAQPMEVSV
jgi:Fe-S cluster biogenesis protein NfuA/nitrite reductase/ring-hydroxylating ferredoxin subunit